MERFIQHEALFIRHFTTVRWPFPVHDHNHFELVFIHRGSGEHILNGLKRAYQGPCLFLLAPSDYHIFEVEKETEFSVLKFNNVYLNGCSISQVADDWNKLIDYLLALNSVHDMVLVTSEDDLDKIGRLMHLIVSEWKITQNANNQVIFYMVRAVFALIWKNAVNHKVPEHQGSGDLLILVADYIHVNIRNPELMKVNSIAMRFNFSPNYLNSLFRQKMGNPIKQYIDAYKYKLIENRLQYSNQSVKSISNEFFFNDLSHFNKFIKKHSGISPKTLKAHQTKTVT